MKIAKTLALSFAAAALASTAAHAQVATIGIPAAGDTYDSASGSGTITAGGQTGPLWQAGNNVTSPVTTTTLSSADAYSFTAPISFNILTENEYFNILVNGTQVGTFTVDPGMTSVSGSGSLASILGPDFQVAFIVAQTVDPGDGSIKFSDGGTFTLSGAAGAVPEPATWALMLLGFGGIGVAMRRRRQLAISQVTCIEPPYRVRRERKRRQVNLWMWNRAPPHSRKHRAARGH